MCRKKERKIKCLLDQSFNAFIIHLLVAMTIRAGGNVLVPCYSSGVIYDLLECLYQFIESANLGTTPFYFISPVANSSLEFSQIFAEWWGAVYPNVLVLEIRHCAVLRRKAAMREKEMIQIWRRIKIKPTYSDRYMLKLGSCFPAKYVSFRTEVNSFLVIFHMALW